MIKCVCLRHCQLRVENKITCFEPNQIVEFEGTDAPANFSMLEAHKVDFLLDSGEVLLGAEWTFAEAKAAMKELFDSELVKKSGEKKASVVDKILAIREHAVDVNIDVQPNMSKKK